MGVALGFLGFLAIAGPPATCLMGASLLLLPERHRLGLSSSVFLKYYGWAHGIALVILLWPVATAGEIEVVPVKLLAVALVASADVVIFAYSTFMLTLSRLDGRGAPAIARVVGGIGAALFAAAVGLLVSGLWWTGPLAVDTLRLLFGGPAL